MTDILTQFFAKDFHEIFKAKPTPVTPEPTAQEASTDVAVPFVNEFTGDGS